MRAFDFIILFFSFMYALALAHLFVVRDVDDSLPQQSHAQCSTDRLDVRRACVLGDKLAQPLGFSRTAFEHDEGFDLRVFQESQRTAYLAAFASLIVLALIVNFTTGAPLGVPKWAQENTIVIAMLPAVGIPLFAKRHDVQIVAGLALIALSFVYIILYYPSLQ